MTEQVIPNGRCIIIIIILIQMLLLAGVVEASTVAAMPAGLRETHDD